MSRRAMLMAAAGSGGGGGGGSGGSICKYGVAANALKLFSGLSMTQLPALNGTMPVVALDPLGKIVIGAAAQLLYVWTFNGTGWTRQTFPYTNSAWQGVFHGKFSGDGQTLFMGAATDAYADIWTSFKRVGDNFFESEKLISPTRIFQCVPSFDGNTVLLDSVLNPVTFREYNFNGSSWTQGIAVGNGPADTAIVSPTLGFNTVNGSLYDRVLGVNSWVPTGAGLPTPSSGWVIVPTGSDNAFKGASINSSWNQITFLVGSATGGGSETGDTVVLSPPLDTFNAMTCGPTGEIAVNRFFFYDTGAAFPVALLGNATSVSVTPNAGDALIYGGDYL